MKNVDGPENLAVDQSVFEDAVGPDRLRPRVEKVKRLDSAPVVPHDLGVAVAPSELVTDQRLPKPDRRRLLVGGDYVLPDTLADAVIGGVVDAVWDALVTSQVSRKIGQGE